MAIKLDTERFNEAAEKMKASLDNMVWNLDGKWPSKDPDEHKVITYPGLRLDLYRKWVCTCGHVLEAGVMGPLLYREFAEHEDQVERDKALFN